LRVRLFEPKILIQMEGGDPLPVDAPRLHQHRQRLDLGRRRREYPDGSPAPGDQPPDLRRHRAAGRRAYLEPCFANLNVHLPMLVRLHSAAGATPATYQPTNLPNGAGGSDCL
jgi:hypothetical protein